MAFSPPIAGLVLILEHQYLRVPALFDDFCDNTCTHDKRRPHLNFAGVVDHQDIVELDRGARFGDKPGDVEDLVRLNAILLTTSSNHGKNGIPPYLRDRDLRDRDLSQAQNSILVAAWGSV